MFEEIYSTLNELFESPITSYQISKDTGVRTQMIDRYRKGQNELENMTMKTAQKLYKFAMKHKNNPT